MATTDRVVNGRSRQRFVDSMREIHANCEVPCQIRHETEDWIQDLLALLFPHFQRQSTPAQRLESLADGVEHKMRHVLCGSGLPEQEHESVVETLWAGLPDIRRDLVLDAEAIDDFDPASESIDEVVLAYPGFYAICVYRIAHLLLSAGVPLVPRLLTEFAHRQTGIDIHPGAEIGVPIVIDHGTGLVVGQSAVIGKNVKLYQGVTLGALSVKKGLSKTKRHPTIEDDVVIYAGATVLGGETVVGKGSVIGGNAWVTSSVPAGSVVTSRLEFERKEV